MDLNSLVPMLASHGVSRFEGYGIKLAFAPRKAEAPAADFPFPRAPIVAATEAHGAPDVAPDLRGDDSMDMDKILFHSAPDDAGSLPLTGEE